MSPKKDPRIDVYIKNAKPFAQPILRHLRTVVHKACPATEEKTKWGMPHFDYKGEMMCSMAAFNDHMAFGFWKASLMKDPKKILKESSAMGQVGRITSLKDLPADAVLMAYVREAMKLTDAGVKLTKEKRTSPQKPLREPVDLKTALNKNAKARKVFDDASYSFRKEYIFWITDAKTAETRAKRLKTAIEWITQGKGRNWKYA